MGCLSEGVSFTFYYPARPGFQRGRKHIMLNGGGPTSSGCGWREGVGREVEGKDEKKRRKEGRRGKQKDVLCLCMCLYACVCVRACSSVYVCMCEIDR